jgi:hypothetical protein
MSNCPIQLQTLSNYWNILRDDGLSCRGHVEQLTFLLFLKMADEQAQGHRSANRRPFPRARIGRRCWLEALDSLCLASPGKLVQIEHET